MLSAIDSLYPKIAIGLLGYVLSSAWQKEILSRDSSGLSPCNQNGLSHGLMILSLNSLYLVLIVYIYLLF